MFLKRCNDWLKVFMVYLIAGVFDYLWWNVDEMLRAPADRYVLIACIILLTGYYVFAGIFMKNVKVYKIILIYTGMIVAMFFTGYWDICIVFGGGSDLVIQFFISFLEEGWENNVGAVAHYVYFSLISCFLIPLVTVLIGKWIGKSMDKRKQSTQE